MFVPFFLVYMSHDQIEHFTFGQTIALVPTRMIGELYHLVDFTLLFNGQRTEPFLQHIFNFEPLLYILAPITSILMVVLS